MTTPHASTLFDVVDCKVFALLTDQAANASPTYGTGIDVPGISQVQTTPNVITAELKGDGRLYAHRAKIDRLNLTIRWSAVDFDVLAVISGGEVTDEASAAKYSLTNVNNSLPYFKLEGQIVDVDPGIGDAHIVAYKCQLTAIDYLNQQSDNFGAPTASAVAFAPLAGGDDATAFDLVYNNARTAIVT